MPARRRRGLFPLLIGLPGTAFLLLLFCLPLLRLFALSAEGGSFRPYGEILGDPFTAYIFWNTFRIGLIVTLVSILLGYPLAFALATAGRVWSTVVLICVLLPFWTSMLVRTYAWMVLLGREGVINQVLIWAGLISEPLKLLHNELAVVVGMVHVLLPFFVFPVAAVMRRIDPNLNLAAQGLGASRWSVFRHVYLPLTLPGVAAGASLVLILSIGFYITPALLGGGRVLMVAELIQQEIQQYLDWGRGGTISVLLLVAALSLYALIGWWNRWNQRWQRPA